MVESQGKVSEKSGNFEMDIEWQPCTYMVYTSTIHGVYKHQKFGLIGHFVKGPSFKWSSVPMFFTLFNYFTQNRVDQF